MSNENPEIRIDITINSEEFIADMRAAFQRGEQEAAKAADAISGKLASSFSTAGLERLKAVFASIRQEFESFSRGVTGEALPTSGIELAADDISNAYQRIIVQAEAAGKMAREVALEEIEKGNVTVTAAQKTLEANGKTLLSYDQIAKAIEKLQAKLVMLEKAEETAYRFQQQVAQSRLQQYATREQSIPTTYGPKSLNDAFSQGVKDIVAYQKALESVGYSATAVTKILTYNADAEKQALIAMNKIQAETGVSRQRAAQIAIASGEAYAGAVQRVLASEKQELLSVDQLKGAVSGLEKAYGQVAREANNFDKAQKQVKETTDKTKGSINDNRSALDRFIQGMNRISSVLGFFSLFGFVINQISQFFGVYTEEALRAEQATFRFSVAVESSIDKMGNAAGTMEDWEKDIDALSKKFRFFSQTDIKDGVAQVISLTNSLDLPREKLIALVEAAASLSQVAGVPLTQAINDITHAMGGSSVTMDKYNVLIREADKNDQALADGLNKTVSEMNSQELALTTLNLILDRSKNVIKNVGDYSETTAGQVKILNAEIQDQNANIGKDLVQFQILWQNLTLDALKFFDTIINGNNIIRDAIEFIRKYNAEQMKIRQNEDYGAPTLTPSSSEWNKSFGMKTPLTPELAERRLPAREDKLFGGLPSKSQFAEMYEVIRGVKYFSEEQLSILVKIGTITKDEQTAYLEQLSKFRAAVQAENVKLGRSMAPLEQAAAEDEERKKSREAVDKAGKDIVKAYNDWIKDQNDALRKRNDDLQKANDDYAKSLAELEKKVQRQLEELDRDMANRRADAETDRSRKLRDLEADAQEQRIKAQQKFAEKEIEIKDDTLKKLQELEMQYLFDLRDAVAENDAVAIKRLERKFNLDRLKIQNDAKEKDDDRQKDLQKELQDIDASIEQRRQKIQQEYQDQLEDLRTQETRRREEINISREQEVEDLKEKLSEQTDAVEAEYDNQLELVRQHYYEKLQEIGARLAEEADVNQQWIDEDLRRWQEYFDGRNDALAAFMRTRAQLLGNPNPQLDLSDARYANEYSNTNQYVPEVSRGNNRLDINVKVSADDLTESQKEQVAVIMADAMEDVIVRLGNNRAR